jgi:pseudaminic acid cytidylyltransferase
MRKIIAVIPARGGSKRISRKNIRNFAGIPAISRTIQFLLSTEIFSDIIVSTDDKEIAQVSLDAGATFIVNRSGELSGDLVTTVPVISDALRQFTINESKDFYVCCVYPINPFLDISNLNRGLKLLISNRDIDYVNPVVTYPYPIERALEIAESGIVEMSNPSYLLTRSQDLRDFVHDAGQWYWGRSETWLQEATLLRNSMGIVVSRWVAQDIDTLEDWEYAELLFKIQENLKHES